MMLPVLLSQDKGMRLSLSDNVHTARPYDTTPGFHAQSNSMVLKPAWGFVWAGLIRI